MPTIDQRILIPAPPTVVWAYISDLRNNAQWQIDCENVSMLTPSLQGPGTRWRSTASRGNDVVLQIRAWYNGLGYEYTYVDGAPFKESIGRIRLQELPEGTVVQWTFSYEAGGLLGGLRGNARTIENTMADSLRKLYKQFQNRLQPRELEAKSLMRDDPGVEARAQYKPRHPSVVEERAAGDAPAMPLATGTPILDEPPVTIPDTQPKPLFGRGTPSQVINEPPISDDDNRNIPVVTGYNAAPVINEPPVAVDDTKPRAPVSVPNAPAASTPENRSVSSFEPPAGFSTRRETPPPAVPFDEPEFLSEFDSGDVDREEIASEFERFKPPAPASPTEPIAAVEPPAALTESPVVSTPVHDTQPVRAVTPEAAKVESEPTAPPAPIAPVAPILQSPTEATEVPSIPTVPPVAAVEPPAPLATVSNVDSSAPVSEPNKDAEVRDDTASIWDIFKIPRPSETQEIRIIDALRAGTFSSPVVPVEPPERDPEPYPPRMGMRIYLRRRRVKLRRPSTD